MAILLTAATVALIAVQQTASRLTWSFARDNALIGSKFIGHIHSSLNVPVWALLANNAVVFIIGCIFLGSSTAFNAFIGTGLVLQQVTYAIPAALLMYRGRSSNFLPVNRPFKLYGPIGWIVNFFTVAFAIVVLIFYNFPVVLPVTGSNMSKFCARDFCRHNVGLMLSRLYLGSYWGNGHLCCHQLVRSRPEMLPWSSIGRILRVATGGSVQRSSGHRLRTDEHNFRN